MPSNGPMQFARTLGDQSLFRRPDTRRGGPLRRSTVLDCSPVHIISRLVGSLKRPHNRPLACFVKLRDLTWLLCWCGWRLGWRFSSLEEFRATSIRQRAAFYGGVYTMPEFGRNS